MKKTLMMFGLCMMALGALMLSGCTKDGPLEPAGVAASSSADDLTAAKMAAATATSSSTSCLTRIVFPLPNQPLSDTLSSSAVATPDSGCTVKVKWSNYDPAGKKTSTVRMKLNVPRGAVSVPTLISLTVNPNSAEISAQFGPTGLVFLKPASFTVYATGLDLSSFNKNSSADFWYVSEDGSGWLQTMQADRIHIYASQGILDAEGIQIPHFSRYCFGR